jgi:hypothetical protein
MQQIISIDHHLSDVIYPYYHAKQQERDCTVLHSSFQFETIVRDRLLGGCEIWVALTKEQPVGLALTDPINDKSLSIREIIYDDPEIKNRLVQSMLNRRHLNSAILRIPPTPSNCHPYGMARILNKEQMTDLYRSFHTHAPLHGLNNQDIPALTQILLHYDRRTACMNLMLD